MGVYLDFKLVDKSRAAEACDWLEQQHEQQRLRDLERGAIWFWTPEDQQIEEEKPDTGVPWFHDIGEGQLKISGLGYGRADEIKSLWGSLFKKLHDKFDVKVLSSSCALDIDYLTVEQIDSITDGGDALSGDEAERVLELIEAGQQRG